MTALPIHFFRHFCCRVYRLVTMHSVTDEWTDRQTDNVIMPVVDHTACDRPKSETLQLEFIL